MTRLSDHHFTTAAPVFGADVDPYDPFYDCAEMTSGESERRLPGECFASARAGHAAGSRSSDGSDTTYEERKPH